MENLSDLDIMRLVQAGQSHQLGQLYERHKKGLFAYFYRCSSDRSQSEDLVQEVFIKVIKYKHQFKGIGAFNYWLYKIARHTWLDTINKNDPMRRSVEIDNEKLEGSFTGHSAYMMTQDDKKERLKKALEMISPEKKDAIILSRYHGFDYKTIAEMSDCTENAIKSRVMRGILEIRNLVNKN